MPAAALAELPATFGTYSAVARQSAHVSAGEWDVLVDLSSGLTGSDGTHFGGIADFR